MEFKKIITSALIITVALLVFSSSECSCFEINGIVNKVVPAPVQCWFRSKEGEYAKENCNKTPEKDTKEHGSLDFFGRDVIRKLTGTFSKSGEERVIKFTNATTGLDCDKTFSAGMIEKFKNRIRAIYPGTKWCGDGDVSDSYYDLGKFFLTDSCCREHDLCPDGIAADETKYGLVNTGLFTRSHCDCDRKFYECLKKADTFVSKSIGVTYFTVLGPQCFQQDYPIVSCLRTEKGKCVQYRQDTRSKKIYQWFDSPKF